MGAGLDSTTAMHLVATLRQLAQGGRAILTTIHQPSSRLYQMLDKLLLLSEGYVAVVQLVWHRVYRSTLTSSHCSDFACSQSACKYSCGTAMAGSKSAEPVRLCQQQTSVCNTNETCFFAGILSTTAMHSWQQNGSTS